MSRGFESYLGIAEEGTQLGTEWTAWGNADNAMYDSFMYFDNESMAAANEFRFMTEIGYTGSQDRAVKTHRALGKKCEGGVTFTVYPEGGSDKAGIGNILKHSFGDIQSYGGTTHHFTPHDDFYGHLGVGGTALAGGTGNIYGLAVNIGREDDRGTIRNYPYRGCRVRSITLSCAAGEELKCTVDFVGRVAHPHQAAKSPAFPSMSPFMWKDATIRIAGVERYIDSFTITITNNLTELWTFGTNVLGRCRPNGRRVVTGSFSTPYDQWVRTEHGNWKEGSTSIFRVDFVSGSYGLSIDCPDIRYTGSAPSIGDEGENVVDMPFQAIYDGSNHDIKIVLINTDTTVGWAHQK